MLTKIYLVRHAEPDRSGGGDRHCPLTVRGQRDTAKVTEALKDLPISHFYSSPYKRSYDTVAPAAAFFNLEISTDERLRERKAGQDGNNREMFAKRWSDFDFHEPDGEPIGEVQRRNIAAINEILQRHEGGSIVIGTHGTALSSILNYYTPSFGCDDFLRIIDFRPYIIRLDFDGMKYLGREELLIVEIPHYKK